MTARPAHPDATGALFSARLTPHRSLGPRGFMTLMVLVGVVSFVAGMAFLLIGAWPVFGFFGLDAILIWLAFRLNYRSARAAEDIIVHTDKIVIRRISARGAVTEMRFNPYWARLIVHRLEDEGVVRLEIGSHGRRLEIGRFLHTNEREAFSRALAGALSAARAGAAHGD